MLKLLLLKNVVIKKIEIKIIDACDIIFPHFLFRAEMGYGFNIEWKSSHPFVKWHHMLLGPIWRAPTSSSPP